MILAAVFVAVCMGFYGLYMIYCTVWQAHLAGRLQRMPWYAIWLPYAWLIPMVAVDTAFNAVLGGLIFFELPWAGVQLWTWRTWMFTHRCSRHRRSGGWRQAVADAICDGFLNPMQEHHC